MAEQLVQLISLGGSGSEIAKIIGSYLLKGTLLTGVSAGLQQYREKAVFGLQAALMQVLFFSLVLFAMDYLLPRILPGMTVSKQQKQL